MYQAGERSEITLAAAFSIKCGGKKIQISDIALHDILHGRNVCNWKVLFMSERNSQGNEKLIKISMKSGTVLSRLFTDREQY